MLRYSLSMEFREFLKSLSDNDNPIPRRSLKALSDLDTAQVREFWDVWRRLDSTRRIEIVHTMDELAEDNVDLDFRRVFEACLQDDHADVRASAIDGLWEDERIVTLHRLLDLLHDPSGNVRAMAAISLSRFAYRAEVDELPPEEGERIRTTLLAIMADMDQPLEVRRRALESASYFAESAEVQAEIGRAYAHDDQMMNESALVAMGRSMRPTWFPYIERELRSPSPAMRYEAARAVGELADEGQPLVQALLPLVDDDDHEVSLAAIWALGQTGGGHARRVLQRLARSKDEDRRQAAEEALEELGFDEL